MTSGPMRVHLDPHTGQVLQPEAVPAYMAHPANYGRVVQLVPMIAISPLEHPQALAGETGGAGVRPSGPHANQQAHHARWS